LNRTPNNDEINQKEHKPEQKRTNKNEQIKPRNQNVRTERAKNRTSPPYIKF
jgi:hypothetical protein